MDRVTSCPDPPLSLSLNAFSKQHFTSLTLRFSSRHRCPPYHFVRALEVFFVSNRRAKFQQSFLCKTLSDCCMTIHRNDDEVDFYHSTSQELHTYRYGVVWRRNCFFNSFFLLARGRLGFKAGKYNALCLMGRQAKRYQFPSPGMCLLALLKPSVASLNATRTFCAQQFIST